MVFPPVEGPPDPMAATSAAGAGEEPQSSNLLHNFSFPNVKRWGDQRILCCANVNRKGEIIGGDRRPSPPAAAGERRGLRAGARIGGCDDDDDGGLEEFREKLMGHLREAVDWIKIGVAPRRLGGKAEEDVPVPTPVRPTEAESEPVRPWNLRTTTTCKSPISKPVSMTGALERAGRERTIRLRSEGANKRDRRPKFSVALTREEIEEDIYAVTASRPRRRPRKRPRIVQKQLDDLFPGLLLSEITADSYKVPDD